MSVCFYAGVYIDTIVEGCTSTIDRMVGRQNQTFICSSLPVCLLKHKEASFDDLE